MFRNRILAGVVALLLLSALPVSAQTRGGFVGPRFMYMPQVPYNPSGFPSNGGFPSYGSFPSYGGYGSGYFVPYYYLYYPMYSYRTLPSQPAPSVVPIPNLVSPNPASPDYTYPELINPSSNPTIRPKK